MSKIDLSESQIKLIISGYLSGSVTRDELAHLQQWINAAPENREYFNALRNTWSGAAKKRFTKSGLNDSWNRFGNRITSSPVNLKNRYPVRKIPISTIMRTAASWLLFFIAGSGVTWYLMNREKVIVSKVTEITAPRGSRSFIKMSDGTGVWLNAGTTIVYDNLYGHKTRTLSLTGEAFFEVAKDKAHPFIVNTSGMVIRALGTRFNVKAYPDEKTISATLEEGKIDVRIRMKEYDSRQFILKEREKIVVLKNVDSISTYNNNADEEILKDSRIINLPGPDLNEVGILSGVNTQLYTSWKDARWIIQGEQLGTLVPVLERRFNIRIVFGDEEIKGYKFTGTIENETVDQIMDLLTLTAPVEYDINKDRIILNLNKNNMEEFGKTMTKDN